MHVPFLDLDAAYRELQQPIDAAAKRVLGSGRFILGAEVERFERCFADRLEAKHCVGVGSGLDALTLALAALGIAGDDEVIVPAATFIATWLAVSRLGAKPVPAPVDEATLTLDPIALEAAITDQTRAIVPVHLYGHPADLDRIAAIARDRGLPVVDDAAQAHGARYRGRPIGALTSASAFSFYPTKNLGAVGDGGAVTTDDDAIAERVRMLRNYGEREKHRNECLGWNSRLDPIQAAILRVKLDKLDEWNTRRRRVAARYREGLSRLNWLRLPMEAPWAMHVYHLYVVRVPHRDELVQHLAADSVATAIHYPVPPYRQPAYRDLPMPQPVGDLDAMHRELLSLPMGPHLSDGQIDHVIDAVSRFGDVRPTKWSRSGQEAHPRFSVER
jgi:dTDP-4-amino-4,6-dideoxygalactose transaminase